MLTITEETTKAMRDLSPVVAALNKTIVELHRAGLKIDVIVTDTQTLGEKYQCPNIEICAFQEIGCLPRMDRRIGDDTPPVESFGIADVGA